MLAAPPARTPADKKLRRDVVAIAAGVDVTTTGSGPLLWIRLPSLSAPGEQLGVGGVELHHLAERQVAPLGQGGEDGPGGRVGQGAVVHLLLGGGLEQTKAFEGAEAGLDAGSSLVARGVRGPGGRGRSQGGGQGDGDDAGAGASEQLSHASPFGGGG